MKHSGRCRPKFDSTLLPGQGAANTLPLSSRRPLDGPIGGLCVVVALSDGQRAFNRQLLHWYFHQQSVVGG